MTSIPFYFLQTQGFGRRIINLNDRTSITRADQSSLKVSEQSNHNGVIVTSKRLLDPNKKKNGYHYKSSTTSSSSSSSFISSSSSLKSSTISGSVSFNKNDDDHHQSIGYNSGYQTPSEDNTIASLTENTDSTNQSTGYSSSEEIDNALSTSEQTESNRFSESSSIQKSSKKSKKNITISYTYDAFFISDGRSRKRNLNGLNGTGNSGSGDTSGTDDLKERQRYSCTECGKHYATSSNLSRHKQTHRDPDSQLAKKCPTCHKVYVSMPALAMHVVSEIARKNIQSIR